MLADATSIILHQSSACPQPRISPRTFPAQLFHTGWPLQSGPHPVLHNRRHHPTPVLCQRSSPSKKEPTLHTSLPEAVAGEPHSQLAWGKLYTFIQQSRPNHNRRAHTTHIETPLENLAWGPMGHCITRSGRTSI